ncbi:MAG: hypothetical protein WA621_06930 [Candidatus Acidiferrum sp.]
MIVVKLSAEFKSVSSDDFGEIVEPLKRVADLMQFVGICSNREAVEANALDAFRFWRERDDSRGAWTDLEALGSKADADSTDRFAEVIRIAEIAEAKLVDASWIDCFLVG